MYDSRGGRSEPNEMPIGQSAQILVYRNGDEHDPGTEVFVTRQQFRHWLSFLDFLTDRIKVGGAVHRIYSLDGTEVRHFRDLENLDRYVAANNKFIPANYGSRVQKGWSRDHQLRYKDFPGLYSGVSKKEYLAEKMFKPTLKDMWDDSQFDMKRNNQTFPQINGNNNQLQVNHNARQRSLSPQPRRSRSPVRQQQNTEEMARSRQSLRSQIPSPNAYKSEMFGTSNSLLTLPQPVRSKSVDYSAERIYHSHEKSPIDNNNTQSIPEWAKDLQAAVKNLAGVVAKVESKSTSSANFEVL